VRGAFSWLRVPTASSAVLIVHSGDTPVSDQPGLYHRQLHDYISIAVDGTLADVDQDVAARPPARVVITMPDFAADGLAHLVARAWQVAEVMGGTLDIGEPERELAEALYEAITTSGYRCPAGGLHLRAEQDAVPAIWRG
jgi:hypothetical protein